MVGCPFRQACLRLSPLYPSGRWQKSAILASRLHVLIGRSSKSASRQPPGHKYRGCSFRGRRRCLCRASYDGERTVKICGITSVDDAKLAASTGAELVGMIAWPKTKRAVSFEVARGIAEAARLHGSEPVAVFVDENAEDITSFCRATGIGVAQLHGDEARAALPQLPAWLQVIYVMHATAAGQIVTSPPAGARLPEWVLVDGLKGGSGESFDWHHLQQPEGWSTRGWLLAGGLHPGNVAHAIALLQPAGVDVSSGVAGPDGLAKDPAKVHSFVRNARAAVGPVAVDACGGGGGGVGEQM